MKTIIKTCLAAFILCNIAFSAEDSDLSGLYFGGSPTFTQTLVKYSFENINVQGQAMGGYPASAFQRKFQSDAGKQSGALEAFVGFRSRIGKGRVYAGGEIYAGVDHSRVTPYDDSASGVAVGLFKAETERKTYGGLAGLLGYEIATGTLAYARLGIEASEWTAKVMPNSATIRDSGTAKVQEEASNKIFTKPDNSFSLVPGFGLHTRVTKNMSVRLQCSWLFGPSICGLDQNITGYPNSVIGGTNLIHNFQISQPRLGISLCYEG